MSDSFFDDALLAHHRWWWRKQRHLSDDNGASEERIRQWNGIGGQAPDAASNVTRNFADQLRREWPTARQLDCLLRTLDATRTRLENARFLRFFEQDGESAVSFSTT
jgi:hypothetical protein